MGYCALDDVFVLALSAQAFVVRPRPFDAVDASTATIRLKAHGMSNADLFTMEAVSGGSLPTSITGFVTYSPIVLSADLFRVALTPNGSPISSWVAAGSGWGVAIDPYRRIQAHIEEAKSRIDECLTAHDPPILPDPITGKYPQVLVGINARMAARAAVTSLQIENAAHRISVERLFAMAAFDGDTDPPAKKGSLLGDWKGGKPIQPRPVDEDNVADNAARAGSSRKAVNWTTGRL